MKIIIIGASGHGRVVADIAKKCGYDEIIFLDNDPNISTCAGYLVLGADSMVGQLEGDLFIAVGNGQTRKKLMKREVGRSFPILIHPNAVVADDVEIDCGSVVMAGSVINPGVKVGNGAIINTCASVDHDCKVGDFVHVSVGAHVAGTVSIGENTWIGAGATVSNNVNICGGCMIGAGAVVIKDIEEEGTYVGVPAKEMSKLMLTEGRLPHPHKYHQTLFCTWLQLAA